MTSEDVRKLADQEYKAGFVTEIEADTVPPGLNEDAPISYHIHRSIRLDCIRSSPSQKDQNLI